MGKTRSRASGRSRKRAAGGKRGTSRRSPRRSRVWIVASVLALAAVAVLSGPFWRLAGPLGAGLERQPSRYYGRAWRVHRGELATAEGLVRRLAAAGYREAAAVPATGAYRRQGQTVEVAVRSLPTASGWSEPVQIAVELEGGRVRRLRRGAEEVEEVELDRPLLGLWLSADQRLRCPVALADLPAWVPHAVLAAEDAGFYEHPGISLSGVVRAAVANLREGGVTQGGSTITQQLVKNLYLTPERTMSRKLREGLLSLLVELRFDKDRILEAYLNEIYWGRSGARNLMGVGAASRAYFGRPPAELDVAEAAMLAAIIRTPGNLDPRSHPEAALARRDEVLARMVELGWLDEQAAAHARASRPRLVDGFASTRQRAFFLDAAAREAADRFGVRVAPESGTVLLGTLDPADQREAERLLPARLARLEQAGAAPGLEAALISVEPASGSLLAYVGGRDYARSQFDRAGQAHRQPGSAFKPVVYAAAFASKLATPATLLADEPLVLESGGELWKPQNADRSFRGPVTARRALEESLNVPTVRLAQQVGWRRIVETAGAMGVESDLEPVPSVALGAMEVTPIELLTVFSTLANSGVRQRPRLLEAVLGGNGGVVTPRRPLAAVRALDPAPAYLVTHVLEGVLDEGTARSARPLGFRDPQAGKTGTTNDGRDSWFAGYSPDRATLVWVGYDDNRASRLSGARAALPLWVDFTAARRPLGGYRSFVPPDGVRFVTIDPATGERATRRCDEVRSEAFLVGTEPVQPCTLHGGKRLRGRRGEEVEEGEERRRRRPWWRRIFRPRGGPAFLPPRASGR